MSEITLFEGELVDDGLKRFKSRVIRSGILSEASRNKFFLSKSQRRRLKSAKARKRERKRIRLTKQFEEPDFKPWVTDTQWPPDMTKKPDSDSEKTPYFYRKNTELVQEEPTFFVFGVAVFNTQNDGPVTVLVKDDPKNNDGKGQSGRWGFPGGGVKSGETSEEGAVREYKEETGLKIRKPTRRDILLEVRIGTHTSTGYKVAITGGTLDKGEEIEDIAIVKLSELRKWVSGGLLLPKHRRAAEAFLEKMKM